jgi:DNA-binding transcriptional regulator YiaG
MTNAELRAFLACYDLRALRRGCGITRTAMAAGLGVGRCRVRDWETGRTSPCGPDAARYARVVAGMARHLEVTWDGESA